MLSLVSSFLFAVLRNRLLLIDQGDDVAALLCKPFPDTTWALPLDFSLRNQFERFDSNHPHCYGNMMKNKTVELSMDDSPPPFVFLNLVLDYIGHDKRFLCDRDQNIMKEILPTAVKARTALYLTSKLEGRFMALRRTPGSIRITLLSRPWLVFMSKCSELKDAHTLLDAMSERDVVAWGALVSVYARLASSH
ncbi:hypothetical protein RHSIM_Rhsim02G0011500 [Rhododendron simsii]|uniref:Fucosyltransferase n=1 Tax=Rhododendron simsii TaxID=118357 RepID=A0A834HCQ7_RHOSS|nr:hypothetical protein RHSIM_Rhsim02G0011500 [Rhododendron simsii]